ncbi:MAG: sodium-dependent transporter, partial [Chlamydiota bacterium]|nr:sodium-dependent transporter [Chlamydiota bacterium]
MAREEWGSRTGFLFAAIGSAIGLGLLWKFPYTVAQEGGGLFLLAYLLSTLFIGLPLLIGELHLGRASHTAAIRAYQKGSPSHPQWRIAGWLGVLSSLMIMAFYSVIAGWGMSYVLLSISGLYEHLDQVESVFDHLSSS